ncbi:ATP-dependent RecD-like DNA helicase [bacterium (Candidatus Blackallbacteria) CG17_big_fil_post_rev_8_21_14_2_50_48_46]|uniref:ATP-dependent RecD-like DNA helicase n=1 Tax=bacterium (Candidatus Blackallbacteria) CG17_big_fil_post_rev_8_21_14_2_50_48_46 TaxID=2014261 RepID=A0A2M7FZG5_9BACT|nr:MAG: ATP-dependent RecD-like DNA helicase [bacterium (Candidatus Blackallbacteria) CG18_big_fil_WC_8_21_14_2_50_49_26]PIW14793.1 MAG: ATP-dependent RecD-like DNA helicase [bacterium (Candidatus Blackallbacteria) CG17_big_fil_post_rev_8_21_14_2_50_48_46]PIW50895.1 MAG: ATP-dependent RecD-like DNA helicase [bacterium (Candidatus Blackallbacteria) CG13_big_fil_rev_8_21_14_2_50_49_14]
MSPVSSATLHTFEGRVREISFQSPESGYTVLQCKDLETQVVVTVVGEMPLVKEKDLLRFQGQWIRHPRFGKQFKVQFYETVMPTSSEGIEDFLATGLIKGIGPATAHKIVRHFGEETLMILDLQPERLEEVPSIGTRKREQIMQSWQAHRGLHPIVQFLQAHGLSASLGPRLFKEYGAGTLNFLQTRPYDLSRFWGLGFEKADAFAKNLAERQGLPWQPEQPERVQAGLKHLLHQASREGHLYLPLENLIASGERLLRVKPVALVPALDLLMEKRELWPEPRKTEAGQKPLYDIYLMKYGEAEQESAERLMALLAHPEPLEPEAFETWVQTYEQTHQMQFAEGQKLAIREAIQNKVFILTGGPGTGKTTVSKAILAWFQDHKRRFKLASPTGRAARRLSEVTGEEALTLHRLLEFDPHSRSFQRDASNPLSTDLILLDEVSMVDMELFADLLQALTDQTRLILIGDADQLPSVGPGAVLAELIGSGGVPSVHLTEIYRQAQASRIVSNAHRVNHGEAPVLLPPAGRHREEDAFFIPTQFPEETLAQLQDLVSRRLPAAGHALDDLQVLCPMRRGPIGTQALNLVLQEALNPPAAEKPELKLGNHVFRPGDRVIQLKNNYDQEIFNGDLGKILSLDAENRQLEVAFADKTLILEDEHLQELDLAYALTIHKAQGAEFSVVVMVLTRQHHVMLQRNLLYTGMTRAKRLLILLGDPQAVELAVRNDRLRRRNTRLGERLNSLKALAELEL